MTTLTIKNGRDTYVTQQYPNASHKGKGWPWVRQPGGGDNARILVQLWLGSIAGMEVTSATLTVPAMTAWAAQNVTVNPITESWNAKHVTWNTAPATDPGVTTAVPATAVGDRLTLDVTSIVAAVAATNGEGHHGFRVETDGAGGRVRGFQSGAASWELTVVVAEESQAPDSLAPQGRTSLGSPVLSWVIGESALSEPEQSAFQVQIDPAEDGVTPDFESPEVTSAVPQYDLSTSAYPGLAAGATTYWRVRVLADGEWSDWSDWAEWSRTAKPAINVTSPAGANIYDPSPVIEYGVATGTMKFYQVVVTPESDQALVLYNSGKLDADNQATIVHTIPDRYRGRVVFADPAVSYVLSLRAWDLDDRDAIPGDPPYAETTVTVTYDDDANAPVTGLWATQVGDSPKVKVRWTRGAAADGWAIIRDGKVLGRIEHDDPLGDLGPVVIDPEGGWSWVDRTPSPWTLHTYEVKALTDTGAGTGAWSQSTTGGYAASVTAQVKGLWLIRQNGDSVVLAYEASDSSGGGVASFETNDRRAVFTPPYTGRDVHILTAFEGIRGSYKGKFNPDLADQSDAAAVLAAIKDDPASEVRMVYATVSVPVIVYDLTPGLPAPDWREDQPWQDVRFSFSQSSEFPHKVGR